MRSTNGNFNGWGWMRNADVSSDGKRNTTAVAPEQPCVPRSLLQQHSTRPNCPNRYVPVERHKVRDKGEQRRAG